MSVVCSQLVSAALKWPEKHSYGRLNKRRMMFYFMQFHLTIHSAGLLPPPNPEAYIKTDAMVVDQQQEAHFCSFICSHSPSLMSLV